MKGKQTKHFVPNIDRTADGASGKTGGIPAGNCFGKRLPAWVGFGEIAGNRRRVTCERCRKTKVFRKIK